MAMQELTFYTATCWSKGAKFWSQEALETRNGVYCKRIYRATVVLWLAKPATPGGAQPVSQTLTRWSGHPSSILSSDVLFVCYTYMYKPRLRNRSQKSPGLSRITWGHVDPLPPGACIFLHHSPPSFSGHWEYHSLVYCSQLDYIN